MIKRHRHKFGQRGSLFDLRRGDLPNAMRASRWAFVLCGPSLFAWRS